MYLLFLLFLMILSVYTFIKITKDIVTILESRFYRFIIIVFLIYVVTTGVWSAFEYGVLKLPDWVFILNSSVSYLCLAFIAYGLFAFVMLRHGMQMIVKKTFRYLSLIPVIIVAVLLIVSSWTNIIFDVKHETGTNIVNGPWYLVMSFLALAYFVFLLVISIIKSVQTRSTPKRMEYVWLAASMAFIFIGILINSRFNHLSILPMAIFVTIYITFTNLQETGINKDALTGLNNRRRANEYIKDHLYMVTEEEPLALFVCDVNSFKQINDVYGHLEGDNALIISADAIRQIASEYSGFAARFGGDEFIFAIRPARVKNEEFSPEQIIDKLAKKLVDGCAYEKKPYKLTASVGYVICNDPQRSLGYYFVKADEMLYKVKREFHEKEKLEKVEKEKNENKTDNKSDKDKSANA